MFETDDDLISFALNAWANEIETGDRNYSSFDVQEMRNSIPDRQYLKLVKFLTDEQIDLVRRIRTLAKEKMKCRFMNTGVAHVGTNSKG